ncbi:hypothetical protein F4V48_12415 [Lactococcus lactis subsp. hordniae]|uniref:Uncharacterized protein n=1 Tax=Lactococcus lactis subsp. hordniae TaxID=203404 RepID=A0A5M9PR40_LACLH|nr:hypothetical protein F4V48_12415 [Lactococcus lactis subsp. hordniae]
MKLLAELFRGTRKTRTKETGNCLFCLLGVWGKRPILATAVAKAFRSNRQTDLTFTIVKSSKLYFTWKSSEISGIIKTRFFNFERSIFLWLLWWLEPKNEKLEV